MVSPKTLPLYLQNAVAGHREAPRLDLLGQTLYFLFWFQSLRYLGKQRKIVLESVTLEEKYFKEEFVACFHY
jgi:hypothetical protein